MNEFRKMQWRKCGDWSLGTQFHGHGRKRLNRTVRRVLKQQDRNRFRNAS